jgi:dTDP-4-amino-4,6-dideoxygalactose transaminase
MSDLMAAIGKEQLANFSFHKSRRQEIAKSYTSHLGKIPSLTMFTHDYNEVVPHIFVVILDEGTDREKLIALLADNGVPAGIHYKPNHLLSYFSTGCDETLPVTDMLHPRLLTLPLHPDLSATDVTFIVRVLKEGIENV